MSKTEESPYIRIGNSQFNKEALGNLTKDEFFKIYKGKLNVDIKEAAKTLNKYFKKK